METYDTLLVHGFLKKVLNTFKDEDYNQWALLWRKMMSIQSVNAGERYVRATWRKLPLIFLGLVFSSRSWGVPTAQVVSVLLYRLLEIQGNFPTFWFRGQVFGLGLFVIKCIWEPRPPAVWWDGSDNLLMLTLLCYFFFFFWLCCATWTGHLLNFKNEIQIRKPIISCNWVMNLGR